MEELLEDTEVGKWSCHNRIGTILDLFLAESKISSLIGLMHEAVKHVPVAWWYRDPLGVTAHWTRGHGKHWHAWHRGTGWSCGTLRLIHGVGLSAQKAGAAEARPGLEPVAMHTFWATPQLWQQDQVPKLLPLSPAAFLAMLITSACCLQMLI